MAESDHDRIEQLSRTIEGSILRPEQEAFETARTVWNARFHRAPALIARCVRADDVAAAVRFARDQGMALSVKSGGHDYAGNTVAEGSLLVDLSPMNSVDVDVAGRRAVVGAGANWGQVDGATYPHGLATPGGTVSSVGVAGFSLGGGSGWLTRKHGLAVDNVRAARVVTAAGEIVRADETENTDLFWAIRGGGGNFGVVTSFEYALHPLPAEVLAGQVFYPLERAADIMRFYRDRFRDAPDELMCYPFFIRVPPMEPFPEAYHGQVVLDIVVAWLGPMEEGAAQVAPFRELGDPFLDLVAPQPYTTLQQAFDAGMGKGNRWYSRSQQLDDLTDAAIDTLVGGLDPFPGAFTAVYLGPHGGVAGRVASDAVAYPHRSSAHELHIFPGWADSAMDEEIMAWADAFHEAMLPHGNGSVYVNLLGDGEPERVKSAYGSNYSRLKELKSKWDPQNLFRANHNIPPGA
jgi:FAD/FMN-containing dehydrogenase